MGHDIHERADIVGDIVHQRAETLHITTHELFARSYASAGLDRSDAEIPFRNYNLASGTGEIPEIVSEFCHKPPPSCDNPDCPHVDSIGRFTRTDKSGNHTFYFCSMECLDATKDMAFSVTDSDAGLAILERVRIALSKSKYCEVDPKLVRPLKGQPRRYFNSESMQAITQSLKTVGQVQPGIIRNIPTDPQGHQYELLDGERRWRGVTTAELPFYRAMKIDIDDEAAPFVVSIIANFNRQDHTLLELVDSIVTMHESLRIKINKIADMLGMHHIQVTQLYGLRRLPPEIRDMMDPQITPKSKLLSKTAAIKISTMSGGPKRQIETARKITEEGLTLEGLNRHLIGTGGGSGRVRGPVETRITISQKAKRIAVLAGDLKMLLCSEAGRRAFVGEFDPVDLTTTHERLQTVRVLTNECIDLLPKNIED